MTDEDDVGAGKDLKDAELTKELEGAWTRMGQARSLGSREEIEDQLRTKRLSQNT